MTKPAKKTEAVAEESPFAHFKRVMRGLMAVPKKELDAKIAAVKRRRTRRVAVAHKRKA